MPIEQRFRSESPTLSDCIVKIFRYQPMHKTYQQLIITRLISENLNKAIVIIRIIDFTFMTTIFRIADIRRIFLMSYSPHSAYYRFEVLRKAKRKSCPSPL
jgi:hypothetical protein